MGVLDACCVFIIFTLVAALTGLCAAFWVFAFKVMARGVNNMLSGRREER